jgi:hypothetical protein
MPHRWIVCDATSRNTTFSIGTPRHSLGVHVAFSTHLKAAEFERYLKSGSGHAFANKRLW